MCSICKKIRAVTHSALSIMTKSAAERDNIKPELKRQVEDHVSGLSSLRQDLSEQQHATDIPSKSRSEVVVKVGGPGKHGFSADVVRNTAILLNRVVGPVERRWRKRKGRAVRHASHDK